MKNLTNIPPIAVNPIFGGNPLPKNVFQPGEMTSVEGVEKKPIWREFPKPKIIGQILTVSFDFEGRRYFGIIRTHFNADELFKSLAK